MSCRKGSTVRTRPQKHQNKTKFNNQQHDTSHKRKLINNLQISEVCQRCQDILNWKIAYKKYKLLTQPKTCTACHQKKIKNSYHMLCSDCGTKLNVCCKCGKNEEVISLKMSNQERTNALADMVNGELRFLPERKRRTFRRYIDKLQGKKKRIKNKDEEDSSGEDSDNESECETTWTPLTNEEIVEFAKKKLDELLKASPDDDDLDDLSNQLDDL